MVSSQTGAERERVGKTKCGSRDRFQSEKCLYRSVYDIYVEKIEVRRCNYNQRLTCRVLTVLCLVSFVGCLVSCVHMDPCMWGKSKQEGAIIIGDWLAGVCLITGQDARACHCHHCKQVGAGEWRKREREYGRWKKRKEIWKRGESETLEEKGNESGKCWSHWSPIQMKLIIIQNLIWFVLHWL